ncbi:MAG TPA: hypothetical protein VEK33_02420 [Terriglobales bacterium]|nr:hypothetical protein [Terriglobales bacterium]
MARQFFMNYKLAMQEDRNTVVIGRGVGESSSRARVQRLFLLSPARIDGIRAGLIMGGNANSDLARRLRHGGVPLGELFSWISGLYFRGKLAYAKAFAAAPPHVSGSFVITACGGLVPPDTLVTLERLRQISAIDVDPTDPRYRSPLDCDSRSLSDLVGLHCEIVLLGSIATPKYVEPLLEVFGKRLVVPAEFIGRGDMSRGGLMLRCVLAGTELSYLPVLGAIRHGRRPPRLAPPFDQPELSTTNRRREQRSTDHGSALWPWPKGLESQK